MGLKNFSLHPQIQPEPKTEDEWEALKAQIEEDFCQALKDKDFFATVTYRFFVDRNGVVRCMASMDPREGLFSDLLATPTKGVLMFFVKKVIPYMQERLDKMKPL